MTSNLADAKGYTALHGAAYLGNNDMVNYLVSKGAKTDVKTKTGDSVKPIWRTVVRTVSASRIRRRWRCLKSSVHRTRTTAAPTNAWWLPAPASMTVR